MTVLRELSIQDFVIVREMTLGLEAGLTVFTGETGAGKSILVDALGLVLGGRISAPVVRPTAKRAQITAVFEATPAAQQWLAELEMEQEDEIVLRRVIDAQGKGRAYINGAPTTVAQLRELGEKLVDIHGQHAHQSLLKSEAQRDLLDEFADLMPDRRAVAALWLAWQKVNQQLDHALRDQASLQARQDELAWQLEQLDQLDPRKGEWLQISEEHSRMSNGQALLDGARAALQTLDDDENGAQRAVDRALASVNPLLRHDAGLRDVAQTLESASISIHEARSDLARYLDSIDLDSDRLEQVEFRMRALFDAARKHHCEPSDLPEVHDRCRQALADLTQSQDIEAIKAKQTAIERDYQMHADKLHTARTKAAASLSKSVTETIRLLGMPDGRFLIDIEQAPAGPSGSDRITLKVAGHDGAELAPLNKVASGGELSRISLALSVLASQATRVPTLIFDEIDTGVSGAVAEKIGELLRQLSASFQVLCVTHLAQVASCAHNHCVVSKEKDAQGVYSEVRSLSDMSERVEAVAKLLGGVKLTATTRDHAREMLERFDR